MFALLPLAFGAPRLFTPFLATRTGNAPALISPVSPLPWTEGATPVMQAPRFPEVPVMSAMPMPVVPAGEWVVEQEPASDGLVKGAATAAILLAMVSARKRNAALAIDGNEDLKGWKKVIADTTSKGMAVCGFIYPLVELMTTFGAVLIRAENVWLRRFYATVGAPLVSFYIHHVYLWFIGMVVVFLTCSRGSYGLSKFVRFNVIQAILMSIILQCVGATWPLIPALVRESFFGKLLQEFFFLGGALAIVQSIFLICFGRYPNFPVLTGAAKLQVQRRDY